MELAYDWSLVIAVGIPLAMISDVYWRYRTNRVCKISPKHQTSTSDDVVKCWDNNRLTIRLSNPSDIELLLCDIHQQTKPSEYSYFTPWLGTGLFFVDEEKWRVHRRLISPAFIFDRLKSFLPVFDRNSKTTVSRLMKSGKGSVKIDDYIKEDVFNSLFETTMGVCNDGKNGSEYVTAMAKLTDIVNLRFENSWYKSGYIFNLTFHSFEQKKCIAKIHNFFMKVLEVKKHLYRSRFIPLTNETELKTNGTNFTDSFDKIVEDDKEETKWGTSYIDYLIDKHEEGIVHTEEEIQQQVDTVMFKGYETTSTAICCFLSILGTRHDIQEKCLQEIENMLGGSTREVTLQDVRSMEYLERCIMETLRLFPPMPVIERELQKNLKLASQNLTIPAKTVVAIDIKKLHRRSDLYENPEEFNPDNFLMHKMAERHYYSFIPFGAGPKSCIGRKYAMVHLKIIITNILRAFKIKSSPKQSELVLHDKIFSTKPDGFWITLEPRIN